MGSGKHFSNGDHICTGREKRKEKKKKALFPGSEDLNTSLGDDHGLLELGRALAVLSDGSPVVGPHLILPGALVDHGLDGEDVSNLHDTDGLVAGIVGNVRGAVEEAVDAVAAVGLHNRESFALGVLLNDISKISVQSTGLNYFQ